MSRYRRFEIIEVPSPSPPPPPPPHIFSPKTLALNHLFPSFAVEDELDLAFDLLAPKRCPALIDFASPLLHELDAIADLVQIETTPFYTVTSARRVQRRCTTESLYLQSLCDRVAELELSFDRLVGAEKKKPPRDDRKYTWTAEIESAERKLKLTAEVKKKKKKGEKAEPKVEKTYKWTAEIKGNDEEAPIRRTYTFKSSPGDGGESTESEKKEKKKEKEKKEEKKCQKAGIPARVVEIEEPTDHGAIVLRQAFAKRVAKCKGKRKELSPQDAAMMIQMKFKAYLIRRSQALRALRELAIAKTKLKEIRALFNNFTYRRRISRDAEERQRFTERIIVLLLTVDAIEGADIMVRASKRSMVDELEAMLDVVDPKPDGRSLSMRRRTFDMPDGLIQKELAESVAQVVQMLDEEQ